ncbi:MAG TPA: hypothetical protein VGK10_18735 [Prolixibacteraceae bacterium]|jgi:hypothetical protein
MKRRDQKLKGIHEFVDSEKKSNSNEFGPITMEEFNKRIDQSEDDFKHGRYHTTDEVLRIIETWGTDSYIES